MLKVWVRGRRLVELRIWIVVLLMCGSWMLCMPCVPWCSLRCILVWCVVCSSVWVCQLMWVCLLCRMPYSCLMLLRWCVWVEWVGWNLLQQCCWCCVVLCLWSVWFWTHVVLWCLVCYVLCKEESPSLVFLLLQIEGISACMTSQCRCLC